LYTERQQNTKVVQRDWAVLLTGITSAFLESFTTGNR